MALPRQVEKLVRETEELERQLAAGATPADQGNPPAAPTETPPAPVSDSTATPQPVVPNPDAPTPTPKDEEKWEQRYRTLKGMYDADVPRLHTQVKDLTTQNADLAAQLTELRKKVDQLSAAPTPAADTLVTDEDVKNFGADLIEVQRKVAREVTQEFQVELDALRAENKSLREQLTTTSGEVATSTFDQKLHRLVPDFDTVNADPRWIKWLEEIDELTRAPRKSFAQAAFNNGDADAVAHFVSLFKKTLAPTPAATTTIADELAAQVQPPKTSTANAAIPQQGKIFTQREIDGMFLRIAEFTKRGDMASAQKLEAEIDAAYTSGRVTA